MIWHIVRAVAIGLILSYAGLALFALVAANAMIFPAQPASYRPGESLHRVPVAGRDVTLAVLHLPNPEARLCIFYHYGNAEDIGSVLPRLEELQRRGYAVVAYDYPGYGHSSGKPSEAAVLAAAEAVLRWMEKDLGWPAARVIPYGRSLGGGPALWLAGRHTFAGVILEGTFTSTFRVMTRIKLLPWDVFDNLAWIRAVRCPILFIHGTNDQTVPFHHARTLHAAAPQPAAHRWIEGGGHNNLPEDFPQPYWQAMESFTRDLAQ